MLKQITTKWQGHCGLCHKRIPKGSVAEYDTRKRQLVCTGGHCGAEVTLGDRFDMDTEDRIAERLGLTGEPETNW